MTKPDVLFIITDHHAWYGHFINPDGRCGGISPKRLPVWEQFCKDGVLFSNAYSICPLCTPARSSMMSGLLPSQHGLVKNTDGGGEFHEGTKLYAQHLAEHGYNNGYVGKWHCGHDLLPSDYDMPGWSLTKYGVVYTSDAYRAFTDELGCGDARAYIEQYVGQPERIGQTLTLHHESPWHFMNGSGVFQGPRAAHESDFVAHLAKEKLRTLAQEKQPFNMVASFWAPHQPYYPSEPFAGMINPADIDEHPSYRDDLADKPSRHHMHRRVHHPGVQELQDWSQWQPVVARCYEQCLQTDAAVGQVLAELEASGRADNTIVIWCADHGDSLAGHSGLWDKAATMTEEVMRIPLAVRWPEKLAGGQCIEGFVSNLDCPATIMEAALGDVPNGWSSQSLLPLIAGSEQRSDIVCEHHGHAGTNLSQFMLRWGKWKYVAALYDGDELYDLETDPWELDNRLNDPQLTSIRRQCQERLLAHLTRAGHHPGHVERFKVSFEAAACVGV